MPLHEHRQRHEARRRAPSGAFSCNGATATTTLAGPYVKVIDTCGPISESVACDADLDLSAERRNGLRGPAGEKRRQHARRQERLLSPQPDRRACPLVAAGKRLADAAAHRQRQPQPDLQRILGPRQRQLLQVGRRLRATPASSPGFPSTSGGTGWTRTTAAASTTRPRAYAGRHAR